jgi:hypothetical protein
VSNILSSTDLAFSVGKTVLGFELLSIFLSPNMPHKGYELVSLSHLLYILATLPVNASRGRNVLRSSKKVSMTPTDDINQQAVASYVRESIWPGNKKLK